MAGAMGQTGLQRRTRHGCIGLRPGGMEAIARIKTIEVRQVTMSWLGILEVARPLLQGIFRIGIGPAQSGQCGGGSQGGLRLPAEAC